MNNFEKLKVMDINSFVEELFLNIPEEAGSQYVFGKWHTKESLKKWLYQEANNEQL